MADVNPIPEGYPRLTPYLCVEGAAAAIAFYGEVFGARERMRMPGPDDTIGHAELEIGDSVLMLADEFPEMEFRSPRSVGGTPVTSASTSRTSTTCSNGRWRRAPLRCGRSRPSSTAIAPASSKTRSGTFGR